MLHVLGRGRDLAQQRTNRSQFGRPQIHAGVDTQTVREVTGRGGHGGRTLADLCLVTHTQRAARHFHAGAGATQNAVVAFFGQHVLVHLGWRGDPQTNRDIALAFQQLRSGTEVTNVGHTRTHEHFVDLVASHFRQQLHIIRVVRAGHDRFLDLVHVDFDDGGVLGIGITLEQLRIGDPGFHGLDTTLQRTLVLVTVGDHPLHEGDVRTQVFGDGFRVQLDGTGSRRTLGSRIRQFEGLLNLQIRQTFDFENAARENVLLALLLNGEQALLDGRQRNGIHHVTQGDARLQLALEADEDRFRHVQRHDARRSGEGDQARTGRERNADRETGVRVTTGTDGIRQQQTVQPRVDDAVTRTQRNAATVLDERWQFVVHLHVHRLRISGSVAERLHDHIGREAQTGQILQLVTGHRAGGILRTHGGHLRFTVGARTDALAFRQATGAANHLLGQREALARISRILRQTEQGRYRQAEGFAGLGGQATTDDQRNTAAGTDFIQNHWRLQLRFGNDLAVLECGDFGRGVIDLQFDLVAHVHLTGVDFDRQCAGIFHGVEEDRGDLRTQTDATETLVRHERNIFTGEPQHRVGGRLTRRTGTDHVADVGDLVALLGQGFELLDGATATRLIGFDTRTRVLQHGQGMQRNVRTRPGIRRRRQIIGVGFAGDLEHGQLLRSRDFRTRGEPFTVGPRLQHGLGVGVTLVGQCLHIVEVVEHQQGFLEACSRSGTALGVAQQVDQRLDVVTAEHGAQQFGGAHARDQRARHFAFGNSRQESRLDACGVIHAGRYAVGNQLNQKIFFTFRRILQQFDQVSGLLGIERQRGDPQGGTLGNMAPVGF